MNTVDVVYLPVLNESLGRIFDDLYECSHVITTPYDGRYSWNGQYENGHMVYTHTENYILAVESKHI